MQFPYARREPRASPADETGNGDFGLRAIPWGLGLAVGAGTLGVLAATLQRGVLKSMSPDGTASFLELALWPAIVWYGWALMAPPVLWLVGRARSSEARWAYRLGMILAGMILFCVLHVALQVLSMSLPPFAHIHSGLSDAILYHASVSIYPNVVAYWILVGVSFALTYYQRYREREVEAVRLESELARAQLRALKMQLHPHFLFNTLHSISTLMYRDVFAADRMVGHLADLLRMTIKSEGEQEIPLRDEMAFLERYLQIERVRFEDRLTVEIDVAPGIESALVPSLVLQPLVENALKHGIGARSAAACVEVQAWREDDSLHLVVRDRGPGLTATDVGGGLGVGLANTRARLDRLYGRRAELRLRPAMPHGLEVALSLPFRTERHD